jgi:hypothetical protein
LCAGKVGVGRIKDSNVRRRGRTMMAAFAQTISRRRSSSDYHGDVTVRIDVASDVVLAVSDLKPRIGGVSFVGRLVGRHTVVSSVVLWGEQPLRASRDEVAGDTKDMLGPSGRNNSPFDEAEGGDIEGSAGCLDGAPA